MKAETLFVEHTTPHITEHLDAFVIIGYTADNHEKFVHAHMGNDEACADGLGNIADMAENWKKPRQSGRKF